MRFLLKLFLCGLGAAGLCVEAGFGQSAATQPTDSWMKVIEPAGKRPEPAKGHEAAPKAGKAPMQKLGPVDIQDRVVFPFDRAPRVGAALPPAGAVVLKRELAEGGFVEAWLVPAPGATEQKPAPLIVYCHGNAEVIDQQGEVVRRFQKLGWSVLLPEYRGYGRSKGRPTQDAIREDAAWFLDEALKRPEVDGGRVVFVGRSLGGGVAGDLASVRKPQGLVLISTFTSVAAMMEAFGIPAGMVKYPFWTDRVVKDFDGPVMVFHGSRDSVIPVSHGRALGKMAAHGTYVELACDHNDFPGDQGGPRGKFTIALEVFLASVGRKEAAATQSAGGPG